MATAASTVEMKKVDHMSAANHRCDAIQNRRNVIPGTAKWPLRSNGRKKFAINEMKDSRSNANEAIRVALSHMRSSSCLFGGGRFFSR